MRRKPPHTERAAASYEAAALFRSTLSHFNIKTVVIPDMQVKLRQGFGRAIRTETDTCVVSILDYRAAPGERYHKAVLETLPNLRLTRKIEDVEEFIRAKKGPDYFMP